MDQSERILEVIILMFPSSLLIKECIVALCISKRECTVILSVFTTSNQLAQWQEIAMGPQIQLCDSKDGNKGKRKMVKFYLCQHLTCHEAFTR